MQDSLGKNCGTGGPELLDDVQSQHYMEQQSATLMVTVLEACGMQPRKGTALSTPGIRRSYMSLWLCDTTHTRVCGLPVASVKVVVVAFLPHHFTA